MNRGLICRSDSIYWLWVLSDCLLDLYSCPRLKSHQESFQEFAINPGKLCQTNITSLTTSKSISLHETFSALLELGAFGSLWLCGLVRPSAMAFAPQHSVPTICLGWYLLPDNRTIISLNNQSHYHLELERLAALVSISFMKRRALVMWLFSCGGWVTLLSQRLQQ